MKVFISYSTKDQSLANKLYNGLRDRAIPAWIDRMEIRAGDSLIEKIKEGIASSDALLALVTKNSVISKWVKEEIRIASQLQKKGKAPRIIPLVVESCEVPNNLKDIVYLRINMKNLNIMEIKKAIYRDSLVIRIDLVPSELTVNRESLSKQLEDYNPNSSSQGIRFHIENHNFNEKIMQVIQKTLSQNEDDPHFVAQIKAVTESLPIRLRIFWTSIESIIEQLVMDLFARLGRDLGTVKIISDSIDSIMRYSLARLGCYLSPAVFEYNARSIGYDDLAQFMRQHKRDDWEDFICERLGVASRDDLVAIDLPGRKHFQNTRVLVPPISKHDYQTLQIGVSVGSSPVGNRWYDIYLPQVIAREIMLQCAEPGILLQDLDRKIGLHKEDYEKAGLG
jgi:hypothetical protein